jgi:hypothetical protein
MTLARRQLRESHYPCRTVFLPFIAVFDAVFDRLFGADRSKAVGESITWPFRRFSHRLKTVKTVETAPHRSDGAFRPRFILL